eukprot:14494855-Ditylum_brightwellii.AAC.1
MTTDGTLTWQGTYCYGITGKNFYRKSAIMDKYKVMLEKWEQEIINNVKTLVSLDKLIAFMQQGQCLIVTAGSASDDMMSFAWKVAGVNCNASFCYEGPAFGKESSFRAEAYGILSVLCFMHQWMENNKFKNKMYTIVYLDDKDAIERITKQQTC